MARLPNIILIVMDTARAKSFSTYGYEKGTTPNMDRIAGRSVVYRNCFSPAPWTTPSHVSLFTGLYPYQHGVNSFLQPGLPEQFITLPQILKHRGYRTHALSSNRLIAESTGFARGFDDFLNPYYLFSDPFTAQIEKFLAGKPRPYQAFELLNLLARGKKAGPVLRAVANYLSYYYMNPVISWLNTAVKFRNLARHDRYLVDTTPLTRRVLRRTLQIMRAAKQDEGRPFFLFINFLQTHTVYNPPSKCRNVFIQDDSAMEKAVFPAQLSPRIRYYTGLTPIGERGFGYLKGLYEQELFFLDGVIGRIYDALRNWGLEDETLFILTSDHGEHIGEKGHFTHFFSLYNELLHVPLIVKYPKAVKSPGTENRLVQTHDLFATILEMVGSDVAAPASSRSLLAATGRDAGFSLFYFDKEFYFKRDAELGLEKGFQYDAAGFPYRNSLASVVSADFWKLIQKSDGTGELYNLNRDFHETDDLWNDPRFGHIKTELRKEIEGASEIQKWLN